MTNATQSTPQETYNQDAWAASVTAHQEYDQKAAQRKSTISLITAAFATIGYFGGQFMMNKKLFDFRHKVDDLTRQDILNVNKKGTPQDNRGGIGFGGNHLENYHEKTLIKTGKHKLAEFTHYLGGTGSMSLLTGAIGAAVGALVARVIVGERPETPAQPNIPAIAVGTPVNRPAQNTQQPATTERAIAEPTPQKEWGKDIQQQEPAELVSAR